MYTQIPQGNWEQGNWPNNYSVKSDRWLGKSLSDKCVLSTGTRKYLKATRNGEFGQPHVQSNPTGGWGKHCRTPVYWVQVHTHFRRQLGMGKLANHLCSQIGQVAGEIIVGHLCTKYMYTQITKGNWEQGNRPTTCAIKSGTRKYLKATRNVGTGQPPVLSNRAEMALEIIIEHLCTKYRHMYTYIFKRNWEWGNWSFIYTVKSSRWLGKSLSDTCAQSTGRRKYLKPTGNGETAQPPVQSNRAGGWGNHGRTINFVLSKGALKYLKATRNVETGQPLVQFNRAGGKGNHRQTTVY
ncbi:hypothetical protein L3X38_011911 [Prunus dulcis]|uniref:Uncharacterized protein n=1 Tax=Prunus dulcis TaxID=3755 RepID=A0AAD4ZFK3_PRUDU|nr:hypothetical protein L3X38_011911 [Prunus dulcis]